MNVGKPVESRSFRHSPPAAPGNESHDGSEQPRIAKHDRLNGTAAKMIADWYDHQGRSPRKANHIFPGSLPA